MKRSLFLFFVLSLSIFKALPQQPKSFYQKSSTYRYYYKLSNEQVLTIYKKGYMDSLSTYLRVKVDSCAIDTAYNTNKLPVGNYLEVWVRDRELKYSIVTINDVYIEQQRINGVNALVVYDKNGERTTDVQVKLNDKVLLADKDQKAFLLPKKKIKDYVFVEHGSVQALHRDEGDYYSYHWHRSAFLRKLDYYLLYPFHSYNYPSKQNYTGYIALNKPKYQPGDTVKGKAFITDYKGHPVKDRLIFYITGRYGSRQFPYIDTISPTTNGSYLFNVPLDSFQLSSWYSIDVKKLKGKKEGNFPRANFLYEDYLLDEASYKATKAKDMYEGKDTVTFDLEAYDATGLPLMDGRAKIVLVTDRIKDFYNKYVQIADTLWMLDTVLSHTGKLNIVVPDSIFPNAYVGIKAQITFVNSNNELHTEELDFLVDRAESPVKMVEEEGYISIRSDNKKMNKGILFSLTKMGEVLSVDTITLPYYKLTNNLAHSYIFKTDGWIYTLDVIKNAPVGVYARRTMDSVFIDVFNPLKIQLSYNIYKDVELIQSGITDSLVFHIKDESKDFFRIEYAYLWNGYMKNGEETAFLYDDNLSVVMEEPAEVTPGETATTKIQVKDYKGLPAAGVNLTASSVNGQFQERRLPYIPVFKRWHSRSKSYALNSLEKLRGAYEKYQMSPEERKFIGIDTLLYYRFIYPDSGMMCYYEKCGKAQVSPYVFSNGKLVDVHMIYIDSVFVYSSKSMADRIYSFKASPGYHQLKLRTADRLINIDSVLIKAENKLELSFDQGYNHSKNPHIRIIKMKPKLTPEELALHEKYMLKLKGNWRYSEVYFSDKKSVYRLSYNAVNEGRKSIVGPLIPNETYQITIKDGYEKEFVFEPGFLYDFAPATIKMYRQNVIDNNSFQLRRPWDDDNTFSFGTLALEMKDVYRMTPRPKEPEFNTYTPIDYVPGSGRLIIKHDNPVRLVGFTLCMKEQQNMCLFEGPHTRELGDLAPGTYFINFYYEGGFTYQDSINIRNDYTTCIRFKNEQIKKSVFPERELGKVVDEDVSEKYMQSVSNKGKGELRGKVTDEKTKKPIDYASLIVEYDNRVVASTLSDDDGSYIIANLSPGLYKLKVNMIGYQNKIVRDIEVLNDQITFANIKMEEHGGKLLAEVIVRQKVAYTSSEGKESMALPQRNVNMLASTVAGVDSRAGDGPNFRGARADGTAYYIDGVRVQGNSAIPQSAIDEPSYHKEPAGEEVKAGGKNGKSIRSDFRDYAYWQPDLITDEQGEVSFVTTYPDNITTWKSYVIAIDNNKRTGVGFASTRAYKKLYASLSVPRFMLEGDESVVNGKVLNYSLRPYRIQTNFMLNEANVALSDTTIDKVIAQTCRIKALSTDTINIEYNLSLENGYRDGEREKIPVLKTGMMKTEGSFHILSRDTQMVIMPDTTKGPLTIYASAQVLDVLLEEMKQLRYYPFYCNEQMASKLIALLYEKQVMKKLNQRFLYEQDIHKLIRRLEDNQLNNGMWGWWKSSTETNTWISAHVLHALNLANKAGYKIGNLNKTLEYFSEELPSYHPKKHLSEIYMISEAEVTNDYRGYLDYRDYLKELAWDSLSMYEKFQAISIYKKRDSSYSVKYLLDTKKQTWSGAIYWGDNNETVENNSRTLTLMAYKILQRDTASAALLPLIARYFLEQRKTSGWNNTYESAKIIDAITPEVINNLSEPKTRTSITVDAGSYHYSTDTFPLKLNLSATSAINIDKKGTDLIYFTAYQTYFSKNPVPSGNDYRINTYFTRGEKTINELSAGSIASLIAEVTINKKAEYVMIEVPIPAGCIYDDNHYSASPYETHREYYKYKTVIFCETLPPGKHLFRINLQARYNGTYTLNPAKIELMYFPVYSGNTALRKMVIK